MKRLFQTISLVGTVLASGIFSNAHSQQMSPAPLCAMVVEALQVGFAPARILSQVAASEAPVAAECTVTMAERADGAGGQFVAVFQILLPAAGGDQGDRVHRVQASPFSERFCSSSGTEIEIYRTARGVTSNGELKVNANKSGHSLALRLHSDTSALDQSASARLIDDAVMENAIAFVETVIDEIARASHVLWTELATTVDSETKSAWTGNGMQELAKAPR